MSETVKSCPYACCEPDNLLLGVKEADGRIRHLPTPFPIDATLVQTPAARRKAEAQMRFTSGCVTTACPHWANTRCSVIDRVLVQLDRMKIPLAAKMPACPIRGSCRWYDQTGETACRACSLVVKDQYERMTA